MVFLPLHTSILNVSESAPHVKQKDVRKPKVTQNRVEGLCEIVRALFVPRGFHYGGRCGNYYWGQVWLSYIEIVSICCDIIEVPKTDENKHDLFICEHILVGEIPTFVISSVVRPFTVKLSHPH